MANMDETIEFLKRYVNQPKPPTKSVEKVEISIPNESQLGEKEEKLSDDTPNYSEREQL